MSHDLESPTINYPAVLRESRHSREELRVRFACAAIGAAAGQYHSGPSVDWEMRVAAKAFQIADAMLLALGEDGKRRNPLVEVSASDEKWRDGLDAARAAAENLNRSLGPDKTFRQETKPPLDAPLNEHFRCDGCGWDIAHHSHETLVCPKTPKPGFKGPHAPPKTPV